MFGAGLRHAEGMNVTRHFSDTRTGEGRVRFLLAGEQVRLVAEGPGWHHESIHPTLEDAATFLAAVAEVPQGLYEQAIGDLERQAHFDGAA